MEQLRLLWELQEVEQEKNKKELELQNIPSVLQYREKVKEVELLEKKVQQKDKELFDEKKAQRIKEMDVAKLSALLKELNQKLYNGKIGNIKELESMEKKVHSLKKDKEQQEDEIIVHMERVEDLESEISNLQTQLQQEKKTLQKMKAKSREDRQNAQKELEELSISRDKLTAKIEEELLRKYRELKNKRSGGRKMHFPGRKKVSVGYAMFRFLRLLNASFDSGAACLL